MDWDKAKQHFDKVCEQHEAVSGVNTSYALAFTFDPLADRYDDGERTQELYDNMIAVE